MSVWQIKVRESWINRQNWTCATDLCTRANVPFLPSENPRRGEKLARQHDGARNRKKTSRRVNRKKINKSRVSTTEQRWRYWSDKERKDLLQRQHNERMEEKSETDSLKRHCTIFFFFFYIISFVCVRFDVKFWERLINNRVYAVELSKVETTFEYWSYWKKLVYETTNKCSLWRCKSSISSIIVDWPHRSNNH